MIDSSGQLASQWQRYAAVGAAAAMGSAFLSLAFFVPRHTIAELGLNRQTKHLEYCTYGMFGSTSLWRNASLDDVSPIYNQRLDASRTVAFKVSSDRNLFNAAFRVDPNGQFAIPPAELRALLRSSHDKVVVPRIDTELSTSD